MSGTDLHHALLGTLLKYGGADQRRAVIEFLEWCGKINKRQDLPLLESAAKLRQGIMPEWYQRQQAESK